MNLSEESEPPDGQRRRRRRLVDSPEVDNPPTVAGRPDAPAAGVSEQGGAESPQHGGGLRPSPGLLPRHLPSARVMRPTTSPRPEGAAGRDSDGAWRGLIGAGRSQLTVSAAMRARDAAQPTAEQLAEAERTLRIVRRGWVPAQDLPNQRG